METDKSNRPNSVAAFQSDSPEKSSEIVSAVVSKVRYTLLPGGTAFSHAIKVVSIGEFNVWRSSTESGFEQQAEDPQNSRFEIHFVEAGQYHSVTNHQDVRAQQGQAYLLYQFNRHSIVCSPQTAQICVSIPEARFSRLVSTEFGDLDLSLAAFSQVVDMDSPEMENLKQLADMLMSLASSEQESRQPSVGAHLLKEAFLALFVEAWPRNGEHWPAHVAKPFYVKRALDWIHEHAAEKIALKDLASTSGVSIRTLQLGFRKFLGISPMDYLLKIRLQHAHSDLLNDPAITIDEIAARWGFASPSKFAAQIRVQYGQNPSDLRKLFQIRRHQQE